MMGRRVRPHNGIEDDATCRGCRRIFSSFQRPGVAAYGKNLVIRRERRWSKAEIEEQYDDYRYGIDPD